MLTLALLLQHYITNPLLEGVQVDEASPTAGVIWRFILASYAAQVGKSLGVLVGHHRRKARHLLRARARSASSASNGSVSLSVSGDEASVYGESDDDGARPRSAAAAAVIRARAARQRSETARSVEVHRLPIASAPTSTVDSVGGGGKAQDGKGVVPPRRAEKQPRSSQRIAAPAPARAPGKGRLVSASAPVSQAASVVGTRSVSRSSSVSSSVRARWGGGGGRARRAK